jgi:hypothetical protein
MIERASKNMTKRHLLSVVYELTKAFDLPREHAFLKNTKE